MSASTLPGEAFAPLLDRVATWADEHREFGAHGLAVARRDGQMSVPRAVLYATTTDAALAHKIDQAGGGLQYTYPEGELHCLPMRANRALDPDRPKASRAIRALGGLAAAFPLPIRRLLGQELDAMAAEDIVLRIDCATADNPAAAHAWSVFYKEHTPWQDSQNSGLYMAAMHDDPTGPGLFPIRIRFDGDPDKPSHPF